MGMYCEKKKCMEYEVAGARPRGRPKKTWTEIVEKDCKARKLNREDATVRKQIRDTDDHDMCEWVNVSSGTGSPRLSRTESREPYNGCVCVCVCVCTRGCQKVLSLTTFCYSFGQKNVTGLSIA